MKKIFTILFLASSLWANSQYKFEIKKEWKSLGCYFVAGLFEGLQDKWAFHNTSNDPFFGQNSWTNKYKNHDPTQGLTFKGRYLVFLTDGFHLAKFSKNLFTTGAITLKITGEKKKLLHYVWDALIYWGCNRIAFNTTYNLIK